MASIPQDQVEKSGFKIITQFCELIHLPALVRLLNYRRRSKVSLTAILIWLVKIIFQRRTLFRAPTPDMCTKRTIYNILNDGRINWQRLSCLLAQRVITGLAQLIDSRRSGAIIVDDTLISRLNAKQTELLANTFDHDQQQHLKGYRGLTLAWSNGQIILPVTTAVLSSQKSRNRVGKPAKTLDQRTLAGQRRAQAMRAMPAVVLELLQQVRANGIKARYVLFDSWFASPKMFAALKRQHLIGIGMLKRTKKTYYRYRGRQYTVRTLYQRLRQSSRHPRANYLYSCVVKADTAKLPLRLVFVAKRHQANNYLVLATTQINLTPAAIIKLYSRRWQIENYFKAAKQYLRLDQTQIQDYDGLCAHMCLSMMTYDLLAWQQRRQPDDPTIGDIFYQLDTLLPIIDLATAIGQLLVALTNLKTAKSPSRIGKQIQRLIHQFLTGLSVQTAAMITVEISGT